MFSSLSEVSVEVGMVIILIIPVTGQDFLLFEFSFKWIVAVIGKMFCPKFTCLHTKPTMIVCTHQWNHVNCLQVLERAQHLYSPFLLVWCGHPKLVHSEWDSWLPWWYCSPLGALFSETPGWAHPPGNLPHTQEGLHMWHCKACCCQTLHQLLLSLPGSWCFPPTLWAPGDWSKRTGVLGWAAVKWNQKISKKNRKRYA